MTTSRRSVLITGCSSGIGLASVRVMKARGWRVLATARKADDLARLARDEGVEALQLELADPGSVVACAEEALARCDGHVTALFNNAAFGQLGAVEDVPGDVLRAQLEVNVVGQHELVRRLLPAMRAAREGRIVQCSSVLGLVAAPYRGAYCASKFALEGLTDALRLELRGSGVHVSLIEPGPIRTRFVANALERFRGSIDIEASPHAEVYRARMRSMEAGGKSTFKLEPHAVAAKLVHALEARAPRRRYYVTLPTYAAAAMRRVLPAPLADWLALKL